jgi:FHA domain
MVGTAHATQPQDIVIRGAGLQDQHAYIINHDDVVTLYPLSELTSVDGVRINKPTRLSQGMPQLTLGILSTFFRIKKLTGDHIKNLWDKSTKAMYTLVTELHSCSRRPL